MQFDVASFELVCLVGVQIGYKQDQNKKERY
jgi:hypothetical protein